MLFASMPHRGWLLLCCLLAGPAGSQTLPTVKIGNEVKATPRAT